MIWPLYLTKTKESTDNKIQPTIFKNGAFKISEPLVKQNCKYGLFLLLLENVDIMW